jgi:hypothetical protein
VSNAYQIINLLQLRPIQVHDIGIRNRLLKLCLQFLHALWMLHQFPRARHQSMRRRIRASREHDQSISSQVIPTEHGMALLRLRVQSRLEHGRTHVVLGLTLQLLDSLEAAIQIRKRRSDGFVELDPWARQSTQQVQHGGEEVREVPRLG